MKQSLLMEKYPVFELELPKSETSLGDVDAVIAALKARIDAHPKVAFIATFDHHAHTTAIGGEIAPTIAAAKNIVFCFGIKLPNPHVLAVRPRSIGVADMGDHFHISFLEPPMELATTEMEAWCKALADRAAS
ncbi:DUF6858 family protein [Phaeovulum vinaykumarii]|uniref:Uncharacterized protein n=1 Tax=Phaeovulum vinaykumarii TaxID=407234 RepID=A0A1N7JTV2_9RHOB|nr:hypothetical protein [Phaeovulum vinaykumarii]SIS52792.1 hypothetical protein SAMN05421795_101332 [Phaeovulum vinaykumarii]SOB91372.1 hypothetical protein SAMN05878426_101332 [Phaeovulum vinaykumarii]